MGGLAGAFLYTAVGMLGLFGPAPVIPYIPLAIQEMVLAVWLIVGGFDRGTIASVGNPRTQVDRSVADARA